MKIVYILMLLVASTAYAQMESWDVYMAQYEKGPGSTVLNMSLKQTAPRPGFQFLLISTVTFKGCDNDGFPTKEQFGSLYTISDSTKAVVERTLTSILAGTFTYQCERTDYYYVTDTLGIRESLYKLYSEVFKDIKFEVRIKADKGWDAYLSFLYPNEVTLEMMSDSKVVLALAEKGDKLEKPRQVDHWIYFKTDQDRDCFLQYVSANNFKTEGKTKIDNKDKPYSLQISRHDKVRLEDISKVTRELRQHAKKCNGDYDGWETFLVTQ